MPTVSHMSADLYHNFILCFCMYNRYIKIDCTLTHENNDYACVVLHEVWRCVLDIRSRSTVSHVHPTHFIVGSNNRPSSVLQNITAERGSSVKEVSC